MQPTERRSQSLPRSLQLNRRLRRQVRGGIWKATLPTVLSLTRMLDKARCQQKQEWGSKQGSQLWRCQSSYHGDSIEHSILYFIYEAGMRCDLMLG